MKKTVRTLLSLLCAATLLLGLSSGAFAGARDTSADFRWKQNGDGSLTLTGYVGAESTLRIPAELDGKPVRAIGESCFAGMLCLRRVYVPEGVERLDDYAFECCAALQKIYLPDSLRSIGDGVFSGCAGLTMADLQDNVESIGRGAFLCCDRLVQLELPAGLKTLGDFAFADCAQLASVRFNGAGVTRLPDRVFCGCSSLSRLVLPEGITAIGKRAFAKCEALTNLWFAAPLTALGDYAFESCAKLTGVDLSASYVPTGLFAGCTELTWFNVPDGAARIAFGAFLGAGITGLSIPASVTEIEPGALYQVHGSVSLDEENTAYRLIDGSLYTADGKTLLAYFPADPYAEEPQTDFTVPDGVEVIAAYALAESGLTRVTLPDSLQRIDAYAFASLYLEEELTIPAHTVVDPRAFGDAEDPGGEPGPEEPGEELPPEILGSVAGDKNLFRAEDFDGYHEIGSDEFDAWCEEYLAYNEALGIPLTQEHLPYTIRYKGEVVPHFVPMTAVQNHDPAMWAEAADIFGDDFEQTYLMMDHGLFTELGRGRVQEDLILYSGLYDSQLMAAAGTDHLPSQEELVDAIGSTFTDPIMISTTPDPGVAANFGDTLFIIYASQEAINALGAVCIDAVVRSSENEILMNVNAQYRILDVGNMAIEVQDPWDPAPRTLYRHYVKVELLAPEQPVPVFEDVPEGAFYHDAACWAAQSGVTAGTSATTFSPAAECTRAQVVTFLWRAAGCPEPVILSEANDASSPVILSETKDLNAARRNPSPFTDINENAYYYKAVLWAVEQEITNGVDAAHFGPNEPCTRAQVVTFLWRANGKPAPKTTECAFEDVSEGYYYKAMLWAVETGVTKGSSETTFSPEKTCTRGETVTFLWRCSSAE